MGQFTILRRDFSGYFGPHFKELEQQALAEICLHRGLPRPIYATLESEVQTDEVILLTNSQTNFEEFSSELLASAKLLIHANSGYDNISLEFVRAAQFPIVVGNILRAQAVASFVLSCLFKETTAAPFVNVWDTKRAWPRELISELNILIIGHGKIGQIVSGVLRELGATIQIEDPYKALKAEDVSAADVIIPLASLNPTSKGIISAEFLGQLKTNALIINAARGALIETSALLQYLEKNPAAQAYLDVFETEPGDLAKFQHLSNAVTSSHIAGVYKNLDQKLIQYEARVLEDFLKLKDFGEVYKDDILSNRIHNNYLI